MEDRAVVRKRGAKAATPYLRRWMPESGAWKLPDLATAWSGAGRISIAPSVLDLGCGDGRNSEYLRDLGCRVKAYDLRPDYAWASRPAWVAGRDPIPEDGVFDLVLCQYLLMFLSDDEIYRLLLEIERVTKPGTGYAMFELQKVKSGRDVDLSKITEFFLDKSHLTQRQRLRRGQWDIFHQAKNRCIMRHVRSGAGSMTFVF